MKMTITAERLREVLRYDPETGEFTRLQSRGNAKAGSRAGSPTSHGYLAIMVDGCWTVSHRWAWLYMTGAWPDGEIDHRNGERQDNRWANLRLAPGGLNQQNRRTPRAGSASRVLGVTAQNGRFVARIVANRQTFNLGVFETAQQAHAAYVAAKRKLHPGGLL